MTQTESILAKFGGARRLAAALDELAKQTGDPSKKRNPATIYKWNYPKSQGGTGGYIPSSAQEDVKHAARLQGIFLRAQDWHPE